MDGPTHPLALKVMRVSRPELANAWQPFYSSSPSFSAHSTASILSLQGTSPLLGYPKTLRDLTHASELLTLPSSFGSIQLGETFSSCLCVNNETQADVEAVSMKVEMQTATIKVVLAEIGGTDYNLAAGETLGHVVHHEIKELGQHVLACSITYRAPPTHRQPTNEVEHTDYMGLQTFRKFYKFAVTNPLSVKTKVHIPRSPTALVSPSERDKVFLEVHIQNLTQEPMYFEQMKFECADGWDVKDHNIDTCEGCEGIFSGSMALMQPQDIRQYIYILSPKYVSLVPAIHPPGSVIPLGRLDIVWRTSFGEPGRLLTSMLSRRIPLLPAPTGQHPASALPSYLKRNTPGAPLSRPQSPQLVQSRPGTPPPYTQRPESPPRERSAPFAPARTQSPFQPNLPIHKPQIAASLIIRDHPRTPINVEKPFSIPFTLVLSTPLQQETNSQRRAVKLVIQHTQPSQVTPIPLEVVAPPGTFSPRLPSSGFSTPSSMAPIFNYAIAHQKILTASPRRHRTDEMDREQEQTRSGSDAIILPAPFFDTNHEIGKTNNVTFVGSSVLFLPSVELTLAESDIQNQPAGQPPKIYAFQDFELSYLPTQTGYTTIGGIRVLLIEDRFIVNDDYSENLFHHERDLLTQAQVLNQWEVVAEAWVS